MPMTRRIGGSPGSPKRSVHSATPFASIIRSATLLTRSWLILRLGTTRPLPIRPARAWRAAERRQAVEERVDQLVRELADEVALPVVAVHPVTRVEDALLVEEGLGAHAIPDEPSRRAQRAELLGVRVGARVARGNYELRHHGLVERELRLAAQVAPGARIDVAEGTEGIS